jgi:hypothetical protein
MSEQELLAKLKGFSRTLVVHSNTNPYAAVAAMGQMAGRSQEAGRYFRPSETFVPLIDGLEAEQLNAGQQPDQLAVEFKDDWVPITVGFRYKNQESFTSRASSWCPSSIGRIMNKSSR